MVNLVGLKMLVSRGTFDLDYTDKYMQYFLADRQQSGDRGSSSGGAFGPLKSRFLGIIDAANAGMMTLLQTFTSSPSSAPARSVPSPTYLKAPPPLPPVVPIMHPPPP